MTKSKASVEKKHESTNIAIKMLKTGVHIHYKQAWKNGSVLQVSMHLA